MGYDIAKLPRKLKMPAFVLLACAFCFAVFNLAYVNAGPHLFPAYFAVDNQQHVYLSFSSGIYIVDGTRLEPFITGTAQSTNIAISDDDILYILQDGAITAVDLHTSLPDSGIIQYTAADESIAKPLFKEKADTYGESDEQDGFTYRYDKTLFQYQIVLQTEQGTQTVFQMPHAEFLLNLVILSGYTLILVSAAIFTLIVYRYAQKHPEFTANSPLAKQANRRLFRRMKGM